MLPVVLSDAFQQLSFVHFPGTEIPLSLRDELRRSEGSVRIGTLESYFEEWFLDGDFREDAIPHGIVYSFELLSPRNVPTEQIIQALGGAKGVELSFAEIFFLLVRQRAGGEGVLQVNVRANSFFVRDTRGVLRNVNAFWNAGRWTLSAANPADSGLMGGSRFFIRSAS